MTRGPRLLLLAMAASAPLLAACTDGSTPEPGTGTTAPEATGTTGPQAVTGMPEDVPGGMYYDPDGFPEDPVIDNRWLPLKPGTRWVWEGRAFDEGERIERRVVTTVTDLTKVINGVRVVVVQDLDYNDGVLGESEIALFAQDDRGNVWRFGEYPEEWEDGEIDKTPTWVAGIQDARAGIAMPAEPATGTPSYEQGWGPRVKWDDRGKTSAVGVQTCVPAGCYEDVVVIREFNPSEPGAHQLKFYAPGIGNVRVGWGGPEEEEREVMELVRLERLGPDEMAEVREQVLEQEARGYELSKRVWAKTSPIELPAHF